MSTVFVSHPAVRAAPLNCDVVCFVQVATYDIINLLLSVLALADEYLEQVQRVALRTGYQSLLLSTLHSILSIPAPRQLTKFDGDGDTLWMHLQQRARRWVRWPLLQLSDEMEEASL